MTKVELNLLAVVDPANIKIASGADKKVVVLMVLLVVMEKVLARGLKKEDLVINSKTIMIIRPGTSNKRKDKLIKRILTTFIKTVDKSISNSTSKISSMTGEIRIGLIEIQVINRSTSNSKLTNIERLRKTSNSDMMKKRVVVLMLCLHKFYSVASSLCL
jgi:hypothetical protein